MIEWKSTQARHFPDISGSHGAMMSIHVFLLRFGFLAKLGLTLRKNVRETHQHILLLSGTPQELQYAQSGRAK
eukprot:scaffold22965_cov95-Skeletonema_dohrnii-CCMP3373.AAC.1